MDLVGFLTSTEFVARLAGLLAALFSGLASSLLTLLFGGGTAS